jgi:acyl dehydratase
MEHDYRFPVDSTTILMFASALGETNPIYYDEEYARGTPLGGVIAPPTFAAASNHWNPGFGLRGVRRIPPAPERAAESRSQRPAGDAGERLTRILHGEQRFEYHKPLRAGMELRVSTRPGRSWEREGRRGGKLCFTEAIQEYRDARGELVVTATSVGVRTAQVVEDRSS